MKKTLAGILILGLGPCLPADMAREQDQGGKLHAETDGLALCCGTNPDFIAALSRMA